MLTTNTRFPRLGVRTSEKAGEGAGATPGAPLSPAAGNPCGVTPAAPTFTDQQMADAVPQSATLLEPLSGPGKVCMTRLELREFVENMMRTCGVQEVPRG